MATSNFTKSTATIGAWNLAAGIDDIPVERLKLQAKCLALIDAEIMCLVEVRPFNSINFIVSELNSMGLDYTFTILEQRNKLNIGFIHKEGIEIDNPRFLMGSDLNDANKRQALAVDVKVGRFDLTMIGVHLKSSRDPLSAEFRNQQADVISEWIVDFQQQRNNREDILLVGDFNMIPGQDTENFHRLSANGTMDFLSSWDLQDRFSHILSAGRANLLDGFAINKKFSPEYIRGSLRVFQLHWAMRMGLNKYRDLVSDHLPFVAHFKITRDSD